MIFSAWAVVPKAIAVMVSYEAERRAVEAAGSVGIARTTTGRSLRRCSSGWRGDRPTGMPALALLYPSLMLARVGDPLEVARVLGAAIPLDRVALLDTVRGRVRELLAELPLGSPRVGTPDQRWYWAAPFLFDRRLAGGDNAAFLSRLRDWDVRDEEDPTSRLGRHLEAADDVRRLPLGPRPDDLLDVLVRMAIAGPGVCALRALSRVTGGVRGLAGSRRSFRGVQDRSRAAVIVQQA